MSTSGRADAVGGVFRTHVATYLAIHGLRGMSVPGLDLPPGVLPVAIEFETEEPTDDIKVRMSDDRVAYISAKRKVGNDRHLDSTVQGWVEQLGTASPGDIFVLAAEDVVGPIRYLEGALRRFRATGRTDRPNDRSALNAIESRVHDAQRDEILGHARLLQVPDVTDSARGVSSLAAVAAYIVDDGNGEAAVHALGDEFARQAGVGGATTIESWEATLANSGLTVIPDAAGLPGQRAAARRIALDAYGRALARGADTIDLTLLADGMPSVRVEGLIAQARIRTPGDGRESSHQLLGCLRRWRRMLIVGSPGAGKTVALSGVAARCIGDPHAPTPIVVRLLRLLRSAGQGLDLDRLVDACAEDFVGEDHRVALRESLRHAASAGTAILICDGLDECGVRASWMAQQLAELFASLDPRNALVVATRPSAIGSASLLDLPHAELCQPSGLRATTEEILEACADVRAAEDQRDSWLVVRKAWLEKAWAEHAELMSVPLLANLVTLICADTSEQELPNGRARVLHKAVTRSVERWEQQRPSADVARPWAPLVTSQMLLDGFIVLGRLLDGTTAPTAQSAQDALAMMVKMRWELAPARAEESARDILRFWDERMAVFVVSGSGELTARSKVFVDIAVAMWTEKADSDELGQWLDDVIAYTDLDEAIGLAAHLHRRVVDSLIELGAGGSATATSLVLGLAVRGGVELSDDQAARCVRNVAEHVRSQTAPGRRQSRSPGPFGTYLGLNASEHESISALLVGVCQLPLGEGPRRECREIVATAGLNEDESAVLLALRGIADASSVDDPLDEGTVSALLRVMRFPEPSYSPLIHRSRRHFEIPSWTSRPVGVTAIAAGVIPWIGQIESRFPRVSRWIFDVAEDAPHNESSAIIRRLVGREPKAANWVVESLNKYSFSQWVENSRKNDLELMQDFASLGDPSTYLGAEVDLWSLGAVGDLLDSTRYHSISAGDFDVAFRDGFQDLRRRWLAALACAYGIDTSLVATQAAHVLRGSTDQGSFDDPLGEDWDVVSTRALERRELVRSCVLASPEQDALLSSLTSGLNWLAYSSANVLANVGDPSWDPRAVFERDLSHLTMRSAGLVYAVTIVVDAKLAGDLAARAAESTDSTHRFGLLGAIAVMPELDSAGSIHARLSEDEDLTVRPSASRAGAPAALYWSCLTCRTRNGIEVDDCVGCDRGTRPAAGSP